MRRTMPPESSVRKAFTCILHGFDRDGHRVAGSRLGSRIALLALVLGTSVACTTSSLAQILPSQAPEPAMSDVARAREALEERSFALLFDVLAKTERVAAFSFDKPCFKCKDSDLAVKDILPHITPLPLSEERAAEIRRLLARKNSFVPFFIKSCLPQRLAMPSGFVLYQASAVSILLIFPECQLARLVLETESPPYFFNVDPIYKERPDVLQAQPK